MSRFSMTRLATTTAPSATILFRTIVGAVFLLEGILKFVNPQELGVGRFTKIGIPFPPFSAPFVGAFEIACGVLLIAGLMTRLAAVPMIVNMIVAIASTKIPLLLNEGFFKAAHEARLDFSMLLGSIFFLLVGAGPLSLDSLILSRSQTAPSAAGRSRGRNGLTVGGRSLVTTRLLALAFGLLLLGTTGRALAGESRYEVSRPVRGHEKAGMSLKVRVS